MTEVQVEGGEWGLELLSRLVVAEGGTIEYDPPLLTRSAVGDWLYAASTTSPATIIGLTPTAVALLMERHRKRTHEKRAEGGRGRHSRDD